VNPSQSISKERILATTPPRKPHSDIAVTTQDGHKGVASTEPFPTLFATWAEGVPKVVPRTTTRHPQVPKWRPRGPEGVPKGSQRSPQMTKRQPKGPDWRPRGSKRRLQGTQRHPKVPKVRTSGSKGITRAPKSSAQGHPKRFQREAQGIPTTPLSKLHSHVAVITQKPQKRTGETGPYRSVFFALAEKGVLKGVQTSPVSAITPASTG
jgi:hypothetical protein